MQASYGPQPGYPYFNQPPVQYPGGYVPSNQAPPQNQFSSYYGMRQPSTPYPPPINDLPIPVPPPTGGGQAPRLGRPKHLQSNPVQTRKSAMKKPDGDPLTRQRTTSGSKPNSHQRSTSNPVSNPFPWHIFVTFRGTNELLVENISHPDALNELRAEILPLWPPISNENKGDVWRVLFTRDPWSSSGEEALMAWDIIIRLFGLLAKRGYMYLASTNTGNPPSRLVFAAAPPDPGADFFVAHFSSSGHRVSIISPPPIISETLVANLKATFPRKLSSDWASEDGILTIDVKKNANGVLEVAKSALVTAVLAEIAKVGFALQTTIPMARRLFGLKSRKEIWIFKGRKGAY